MKNAKELQYSTREEEQIVNIRYLKIKIEDKEYEIKFPNSKKFNILLDDLFGKQINFKRIEIDNKIFWIYTDKKNRLYLTNNFNKILNRKSNLRSLITKKHVFFFGLYSNIETKYKDFDNIYLNEEIIGKIERPFNFWKFKHLAIIRVKIEQILKSSEIHNKVAIGDKNGNVIPLNLKKNKKGINYFCSKIVDDNYILVRTVINSSIIRIVNIKMSPEYKKINLLKNNLAHVISKIIGKKEVILMFEKETKKASESGYYVFEKLMELKNLKSKIYFVIDKNCTDYKKVIEKYPKNTIIKYSFKHYLNIYISKYFISSELSNHVINPRLYIRNLNEVISKKPLIFLQHGIMFSKPVDNPAAAGFRKNSKSVNYYKSVISSELEATQFYKVGFQRKDLIKCGLPKFDISRMNKDADKIMVMLTYRYWEEALIMNESTIKETTYYKTYLNIIKEFEKNNLLDNLIISCHPKFSDCLIKTVPKYKKVFETDIAKALEETKIFVTDYSSASYDAHYRGAYIIYYWEEKEYLIENYNAIPPINEENCDGVPVYSIKSLIEEVKTAQKNNYVMEKKYEDNYKMINEFHDGKNADRLILELKKLGIIEVKK